MREKKIFFVTEYIGIKKISFPFWKKHQSAVILINFVKNNSSLIIIENIFKKKKNDEIIKSRGFIFVLPRFWRIFSNIKGFVLIISISELIDIKILIMIEIKLFSEKYFVCVESLLVLKGLWLMFDMFVSR